MTLNRQELRAQMGINGLAREFAGIFGRETIERFADESLSQLLERATVPAYVPLLAGRFARDRLRALAQADGLMAKERPEVLFVCVHNAGRSQMAALLTTQLSRGKVGVRSAGSEPAGEVLPIVTEAMGELGLELADAFPKPLTDEVVRAADVVITMGCGDACPLYPGKRYLDWEVEDPAGQSLERVRAIRDDIRGRVEALLEEMEPEVAAAPPAR